MPQGVKNFGSKESIIFRFILLKAEG